MKRALLAAWMLGLIVGSAAAQQKLGKAIDVKAVTPIKTIMASPDKYLGKDVRIEGEITKVCQMAGCWILVKDSSSPDPIMVKVDDGVIVFPKDGAGKKVIAQGKLEKVADEAQEEAGAKSPYRLKGAGAIVQ
jgi:RecJ-like exonuclease